MPATLVQKVLKYSCQSYVVTSTVPSSSPVGCATFTDADSFTTPTKSARPPTSVLLYFFFRSPKHQSGLNFVWPGIMNESVISLCWPVITLHRRYCTMIAFLFCPPQLSACRCTLSSPSPWFSKKWWSMLTMALEPFPMSTASSMR